MADIIYPIHSLIYTTQQQRQLLQRLVRGRLNTTLLSSANSLGDIKFEFNETVYPLWCSHILVKSAVGRKMNKRKVGFENLKAKSSRSLSQPSNILQS